MLAGLLFELHPSVSVSLYIHRLSYILLARDIYPHLPPIGKLSKSKNQPTPVTQNQPTPVCKHTSVNLHTRQVLTAGILLKSQKPSLHKWKNLPGPAVNPRAIGNSAATNLWIAWGGADSFHSDDALIFLFTAFASDKCSNVQTFNHGIRFHDSDSAILTALGFNLSLAWVDRYSAGMPAKAHCHRCVFLKAFSFWSYCCLSTGHKLWKIRVEILSEDFEADQVVVRRRSRQRDHYVAA